MKAIRASSGTARPALPIEIASPSPVPRVAEQEAGGQRDQERERERESVILSCAQASSSDLVGAPDHHRPRAAPPAR